MRFCEPLEVGGKFYFSRLENQRECWIRVVRSGLRKPIPRGTRIPARHSRYTNPCASLEVRVANQFLFVMLQEAVTLGNANQTLGDRGFYLVAHGG